jgi:hypothetical protein
VFNGDGANLKNQDDDPALIGRVIVAPLAALKAAAEAPWLAQMWIGGSIWWQPTENLGGFVAGGSTQNDLPPMTTPGGVTLFSSTTTVATDPGGNPLRAHLAPSGQTLKGAVEVNLPFRWLGARFELITQSMDLAEYVDTVVPVAASQQRAPGARGPRLDGNALYLEAWAWLIGDARDLAMPGQEPMPRLATGRAAAPRLALQLAARYEHAAFSLSGLPAREDPTSGMLVIDPAQGNYELHTFAFALNGWAGRHARATLFYEAHFLDGDAPNVTRNFYFRKLEHEVALRLQIAL